MPLRLLSYIINFYERKYKTTKTKSYRLVFPLVLYNGKSHWSAAKHVEDMVDIIDNSLPEYVIRQKRQIWGIDKMFKNILFITSSGK